MCVELLRVLPVGSSVKGVLQLKSADVPFAGRVAWSRSGDAYLGVKGRMGVIFTSIAPEFSTLLTGDGPQRSSGT